MSAHVLLNLLNELGKRDKMRGLWSILSLFCNEFNKFNNTRARMLDSIYHMTNTLKSDFWRKNVIILSLCMQRCYGRHNVSPKSINPLGDNCIQNFHLGRFIVGYTVRNLVLRRCISGAVNCDFRTYIRRYTSPNENFEYGYPHSKALINFSLKKDSENVLCCAYTSSGCQLHKTACQQHIFTSQPMKSDVT